MYVCPSNLHVGMIYKDFAPGIMVAPQNCNFKGCGAYTGEMAVDQMVDMGLKVRITRLAYLQVLHVCARACVSAPVHTGITSACNCVWTNIVLPDWSLGAPW